MKRDVFLSIILLLCMVSHGFALSDPLVVNEDLFSSAIAEMSSSLSDPLVVNEGTWAKPVPLRPGILWHGYTGQGVSTGQVYNCQPAAEMMGPEQVYQINIGDPNAVTVQNDASLSLFDLYVKIRWYSLEATLEVFLLKDPDPQSCLAHGLSKIGQERLIILSGLSPGPYYLAVDSLKDQPVAYDIIYFFIKRNGRGTCLDPIPLPLNWFDKGNEGYGGYFGDTLAGEPNLREYSCSQVIYDGPERIHMISLGNAQGISEAGQTWDLMIALNFYENPNMNAFLLSDCDQKACLAASWPGKFPSPFLDQGLDNSVFHEDTFGRLLVGCNLSPGIYYIVVDACGGSGKYAFRYKAMVSSPGTCERPIALPLNHSPLDNTIWEVCGGNTFCGNRGLKVYSLNLQDISQDETWGKGHFILNLSAGIQMKAFLLKDCPSSPDLDLTQAVLAADPLPSQSTESISQDGVDSPYVEKYAFCSLDPGLYYLAVGNMEGVGGYYRLRYAMIREPYGTCGLPIELNKFPWASGGGFSLSYSGTTVCGPSWYERFPDLPYAYDGPDRVHHLKLYQPFQFQVRFDTLSSEMGLFLLSHGCDPQTTLFYMPGGESPGQTMNLESGDYYLIVDSYSSGGDYRIELGTEQPPPDTDGDRIPDPFDLCPKDGQNDADGDGRCRDADNCPEIYNPDQADRDGDERGDVCDNCPDLPNPEQADADGDGIGNVCDICPYFSNPDQDDSQGPVPSVDVLPRLWVEYGETGTTNLAAPMAFDLCTDMVTATMLDPLPSAVGTYTITWIYEDRYGNVSIQEQEIVVQDTQPPEPDLESLPLIERHCEIIQHISGDEKILACDEVILIPPTATDNLKGTCIGQLTGATSNLATEVTDQNIYRVINPEPGVYVVTWTYDDGNGNERTQEQVISLRAIALVGGDKPFKTIQDGINAVSSGDKVRIATGNYLEPEITMKEGVILEGGWDPNFLERDPNTNKTILSGSSLVFRNISEARIDGLIISNHYSYEGRAKIIAGNSANCGGGIFCDHASPIISDCIIRDNAAFLAGGGIYCMNYSSPVITNCTITHNDSDRYGGGICCCLNSHLTIQNSRISGNTALYGGGIYADTNSSIDLVNCTILENDSSYEGGGLYIEESSISLTNCTSWGNTAVQGSGLFSMNSFLTITNSIFWDDTPGEIWCDSNSICHITYSDIKGGYGDPEVTHNFDQDPLFKNVQAKDFSLLSDLDSRSPCIDAGTNQGAPEIDKNGASRPYDGDCDGDPITDLGAYEYRDDQKPKPKVHPLPDLVFKAGDNVQLVSPKAMDNCAGEITATTGDSVPSVPGNYLVVWTYDDGRGNTEDQTQRVIVKKIVWVGPDQTYTRIEQALINTEEGDRIRVAGGLYEDTNIVITTEIELEGGWNSDFTQRNPELYPSILAGNGLDPVVTVIDANSPLIDGLTLTQVFEQGALRWRPFPQKVRFSPGEGYPSSHGLCCIRSSPTISNCLISGNSASSGGGIYCQSSSPQIIHCLVRNNTAYQHGGGIFWTADSRPTIINCQFYQNTVQGNPDHIHAEGNPYPCQDISLVDREDFQRVSILLYSGLSGTGKSAYRFFGKSCGTDLTLQPDDLLAVHLQP